MVWEGHPWITPGLVGITIEAVAAAVVITWIELLARIAFKPIAVIPLLAATYVVVFLLWLAGAIRLFLVRASSHYVLRGSSLEVQHGILSRRIYTVSAAGFSDLQVIKSLIGRLLNTGTIIVETDSDRDVRLLMVHDPINVSRTIRQVMTVPVFRVADQGPAPPR